MKNQFQTLFRGLILAAMSMLITKANAQTTITPANAVGQIEGFTTLYSISVQTGDTAKVWWEYSSDNKFLSPDTLPSRIWTKDSSKVRDTFDQKKNHLPPVDSITGYTLYLRLAMEIKGVVTYGTPTLTVSVYPKPLKIKVTNFSLTPLSNGCVVGFFGSTGSNFQRGDVIFKFRYGSADIWRKPAPDSTTFTGMNQSFSRSLAGMLSNKSVNLWVKVKNNNSYWDTIITLTTTPTSTKPVVAEGAGKLATADSAFIKVDATSFNLSTKVYCINTVTNDTLIQSTASVKLENLAFRFGKLAGNTKYIFKVYGINSMGTGNVINITITTQPKLVTPTFIAQTPDVKLDVANWQYYILPKIDWLTNSTDKVKRIDVRIYTDSLYQSVPMVWKIADAQAGLTGPLSGARIDSDSGRFWYEYIVETEKSIYTSNLLGYDVNWKKLPVNILSTKSLAKIPNGPVQCKLYNMSGQLVSENWIVDPKVNLFSNDLPMGQLIAVPIEIGYSAFRIWNNK